MRFKVGLLFVLSLSAFANAKETPKILEDFETDGCTMFVDGPSDKPDLWAHCCFEHDLRYWFGGAGEDKKFSDVQLRECVRDVAGNFWANLIYNGVKAGNFSPVKFKYVWSWGWTPKREREKLSEVETKYIIEKINALNLDAEFREKFITKYLTKSTNSLNDSISPIVYIREMYIHSKPKNRYELDLTVFNNVMGRQDVISCYNNSNP
ncbi:MAG: hypothetical protein V4596_14100 [Bdellovibrionota bacterium]